MMISRTNLLVRAFAAIIGAQVLCMPPNRAAEQVLRPESKEERHSVDHIDDLPLQDEGASDAQAWDWAQIKQELSVPYSYAFGKGSQIARHLRELEPTAREQAIEELIGETDLGKLPSSTKRILFRQVIVKLKAESLTELLTYGAFKELGKVKEEDLERELKAFLAKRMEEVKPQLRKAVRAMLKDLDASIVESKRELAERSNLSWWGKGWWDLKQMWVGHTELDPIERAVAKGAYCNAKWWTKMAVHMTKPFDCIWCGVKEILRWPIHDVARSDLKQWVLASETGWLTDIVKSVVVGGGLAVGAVLISSPLAANLVPIASSLVGQTAGVISATGFTLVGVLLAAAGGSGYGAFRIASWAGVPRPAAIALAVVVAVLFFALELFVVSTKPALWEKVKPVLHWLTKWSLFIGCLVAPPLLGLGLHRLLYRMGWPFWMCATGGVLGWCVVSVLEYFVVRLWGRAAHKRIAAKQANRGWFRGRGEVAYPKPPSLGALAKGSGIVLVSGVSLMAVLAIAARLWHLHSREERPNPSEPQRDGQEHNLGQNGLGLEHEEEKQVELDDRGDHNRDGDQLGSANKKGSLLLDAEDDKAGEQEDTKKKHKDEQA